MNWRVTHTHELNLLQEEVPETRDCREVLLYLVNRLKHQHWQTAGEVAPAFPYFFLNPSSWLPSLTMAMG